MPPDLAPSLSPIEAAYSRSFSFWVAFRFRGTPTFTVTNWSPRVLGLRS